MLDSTRDRPKVTETKGREELGGSGRSCAMRITSLMSQQGRSGGPPGTGLGPGFPDGGPRRPEGEAMPQTPGFDAGDRLTPGLSSPHPLHPTFTAISWVVLQEVKSDAAMALLRLELLRRQH